MKILLIGNGARENAIAWKITSSPSFKNSNSKLFAAPGNPGINQFAEAVNISAIDIPALKDFAIQNKIDFTVVGPEIPLSLGIVDEFAKENLKYSDQLRHQQKLRQAKFLQRI